MIEQLREKYIWKDGFSEMAKSGEEGGQIGGGRSKGSSEIILGEKKFWLVLTPSPRMGDSNYTQFCLPTFF